MPQFPAIMLMSDTSNFVFGRAVRIAGAYGSSGNSVSFAGDVNGDGVDDILIGNKNANTAHVVFGGRFIPGNVLSLETMTTANGISAFGPSGNLVGHDVAAAGDINGDGFADFLVSDRSYGDYSGGVTYLVFGRDYNQAWSNIPNLAAMPATEGFALIGDSSGDYSGTSVSAAGDVNGDGFDDLIIGAPGDDETASGAGRSFVVFGKSGGFGTSFNLVNVNGTNGFAINGEAADDNSGFSVSGAGDFNGDGFADILVGVPKSNFGGTDSGVTALIFGGPALGVSGSINLSSTTSWDGIYINGEAAGDQSGFAVSSAGDLNGDGFDDILIGAKYGDDRVIKSGASYVIFGKAGGGQTTLNLGSLNGSNGFKITGSGAYDYSGWNVSSAGDVNGDGFGDIVIGAPYADGPGTSLSDNRGAAYVVFGKAGGFASHIVLSTLNGSNGFKILGAAEGERLGKAVSGGGDFNHDGFDDILIGAPKGGGDFANSYIIYGHATGTLNRMGSDGDDFFGGGEWDDTFDGRGGDDLIRAGLGDDLLKGGSDQDQLFGDVGDDVLEGGSGFDLLDGGFGADILRGGSGGDTYQIFTDMLDIIVEAANAPFESDTVSTAFDFVLPTNVENLYFISSSNRIGTGNGLNNRINGGSGADTLSGLGGNDTLRGGFEPVARTDSLRGGLGDDTYELLADSDSVVELLNQGTDTIISTVSRSIAAIANVENLTLFAGTTGTGNTLNNVITGNAATNTLNGGAGNDTLLGLAGTDTLNGDAGNDTLDGGVDAVVDQLKGGLDNDTYVLGASTNDVITDTGGTADLVTTTINRTLVANIENLTLLVGASNGTGNTLDNIITGNSAVNILIGGIGADTLIGGLGADTLTGSDALSDKYRYNASNEGGDTITAFDAADFFQFKGSAFGVTAATLPAAFLSRASGHTATTTAQRFIFDQATDQLWYDSNGSTAGGTVVMIADLANNFNLLASDIQII